ncbi:MAG: DUF6778 family protein [Maritimibacter sp.]
MKPMRVLILAGACLALAACGSSPVSRADMANMGLLKAEDSTYAPVPLKPSYRVSRVDVKVPSTLVNTEENSYKPAVDIIWREDPMGNRHAQVDKIMTDALTSGTRSLKGVRPVVLDVTVLKFHALTQRTRYSIGGTHHLIFAMRVRDAKTGKVVEPVRVIETEFEAYGGDKAIAAEAKGLTQKVRITQHMQNLIQYEMTRPRDFLQEEMKEAGAIKLFKTPATGAQPPKDTPEES